MHDLTPHFKIKGRQVNLRTTIRTDIADYERWNNPDLLTWQYDGPYHRHDLSGTIVARQRWLAGNHAPPYNYLEIETTDAVHIGWVVVYPGEGIDTMPEFGINIVEDSRWSQGLGTESVRLWVDYLFQTHGFHRLGFSTWSGNERMIAIGRRLGFIEESRVRKGCKVRGKYYDRIKMGLLREEWRRKAPEKS